MALPWASEQEGSSMPTTFWIVLILVALGVIVSLRYVKTSRDPLRPKHLGMAPPAPSLADQSSQREDRRLAGMSAEDRAWEQATLQRQRDKAALGQNPSDSPS
jgi:hypothetical protein